jgi:hypothetical protein
MALLKMKCSSGFLITLRDIRNKYIPSVDQGLQAIVEIPMKIYY